MDTALLPPARLMAGALAPLPSIVRAASAVPLTTPTPCAGWDLAALVRHLLHWAPLLAAAGRRTDAAPVADSESQVSLDGWTTALPAALEDVADAWSSPAAWTGTTSMMSPDPLPAPMIGGMVLGELVVHSWDLGRAVGVEPEWADDVLAATHDAVLGMAEQGREMGIFGAAVDIAGDAPALHRIVAATGRTP